MYVTENQIRNLRARLVYDDDGCLVWTGAKFRFGHGQIRIGSQKNGTRRLVETHRLAYFLEHGEIPEGVQIRHRCDKPACCLIAHLEPGTQQDNMNDMVARGRSTGNKRDNKGEENPGSVLRWEQVREIRKTSPLITNVALGKRFGVSHAMISLIRLNKAWIE